MNNMNTSLFLTISFATLAVLIYMAKIMNPAIYSAQSALLGSVTCAAIAAFFYMRNRRGQ